MGENKEEISFFHLHIVFSEMQKLRPLQQVNATPP